MYHFGDLVTVKAFPNLVLSRRVVGLLNERTVYLCNEEEFQLAKKQSRKPSAVGFPIQDVIASEKAASDSTQKTHSPYNELCEPS